MQGARCLKQIHATRLNGGMSKERVDLWRYIRSLGPYGAIMDTQHLECTSHARLDDSWKSFDYTCRQHISGFKEGAAYHRLTV